MNQSKAIASNHHSLNEPSSLKLSMKQKPTPQPQIKERLPQLFDDNDATITSPCSSRIIALTADAIASTFSFFVPLEYPTVEFALLVFVFYKKYKKKLKSWRGENANKTQSRTVLKSLGKQSQI